MTMKKLRLVPALLMVGILGACDTDMLDILPQDEIAQDIAIIDLATAEAALNGAYSSLQSGNLIGGDYIVWTDLISDDVEHTGTFGSYGQADLINIPADNGSVAGIWDDSYDGILRTNMVIAKVPEVDGLDAADVDRIVGQAYGLRALHYFHLLRAYGGVPIVLDPSEDTEDIFRLAFIAVDFNNFGYYYQFEGRFEVGATQEIYDAFDQANDERFAAMFDETRPDGIEVVKYPTTAGTEDVHVLRYAEVLLILAEALAQQGTPADLTAAVGYLNDVRTRAGLAGYVYPVDLTTQQEVLDAIFAERRLELAFEGERWFDLVRTDRAAAELGVDLERGVYAALLGPAYETPAEVQMARRLAA